MNKIPKHTVIEASAGTGKTYRLSMRYIKLLSAGAQPDEILTLTFTRAAAAEMLGRILCDLAKAATNEKDTARVTRDADIFPTPKKEDFASWLTLMLTNLHKLHIATYDSFFSEIARLYALELGLNPNFEPMSEAQEKDLQRLALGEMLKGYRDKKRKKELFEKLSSLDEKYELRHPEENVLQRLQNLSEIGADIPKEAWGNVHLDPDCPKIVGLAPIISIEKIKRASAKRVQETLNRDLSKAWKDEKDITLNSQVKKIISAKTLEEGFANLLRDVTFPTVNDASNLRDSIRGLGRRKLEHAIDETKALQKILEEFILAQTKLKQEKGLLSYHDITKAVSNVLAKETLSARATEAGLYISFRLDSCIKHILIDEFQDTSHLQWSIMHPICDEIIQDQETRSFFAVGDIKQAIYAWRGGKMEILLNLIQHYGKALDVLQLTESYRSCQEILQKVNHSLIGDSRFRTWLNKVEYRHHKPAEKLKDVHGYYEKCRVQKTYNGTARVEHYLEQEAVKRILEVKPYEKGLSSAVLVRTNAQAESLLGKLREQGVPCAPSAKVYIKDYPETRLLLTLFKLLDNPGDQIASVLLERSPLLEIFKEEKDFGAALSSWRRFLLRNGYGKTAEKLVKLWNDTETFPANQFHLSEFVQAANDYQTKNPTDFDAFITYIEKYTRPHEASDPARVVVTTIHSAKGLTFDVVFYLEYSRDMSLLKPDSFLLKEEKLPGENIPSVTCFTKQGGKLARFASSEYAEILEKTKEDLSLDECNVIYVALTRAARALYVFTIVPMKNYAEFLSLEVSDILIFHVLSCLMDIKEHGIEYTTSITSNGDPYWYEDIKKKEEVVASPITAEELKVKFQKGLTRRRKTVSPSQLGHQTKEIAAENSQGLEERRELAMLRGTAVHLVCSWLLWNDEKKDGLEEKLLLAMPELSEKQAKEIVTLVFNFVGSKNDEVFQKPDEPVEVRREMPFMALKNEALLNGIMDRVHFFPNAENPQKIIVYDFKTGAEHEENEPQIEAYVQVLKEMYALENVTGKLVYLEK